MSDQVQMKAAEALKQMKAAEALKQMKAAEALKQSGGNWVTAAKLLEEWCEQDEELFRAVVSRALPGEVWKAISRAAKQGDYPYDATTQPLSPID